MLKPEDLQRLATEASLDERTVARLAMRKPVRGDIRRRVTIAAERLRVVLPRGFFATAPDESAA